LFFFIACSGGNAIVSDAAGQKVTITIDGVSFAMAYVPGGLTFLTGVNDDCIATVANAYWIGETEVTYELWSKVYTWATTGTLGIGAGSYVFANPGVMGDGSGDTNQHPVTTVNWRDVAVWCNALTEWHNAQKGTSYNCVYYTNSNYTTPLRTSTNNSSIDSTNGSEDYPYIYADAYGNMDMANCTSKGFRLLTSNEWELVARYRDGTRWTYGDHVSGDDSGACYYDGSNLGGLGMSTAFGDYAVYSGNSGSSTAIVKNKTENALGLYDMGGNVLELCFTLYHGSYVHMLHGGSWSNTAQFLQVGCFGVCEPYLSSNYMGFRFARTQ